MLISICIAEYMAEKYIDKNLESILRQTYKNVEIILYDDASPDLTRKKMLEYSTLYPEYIFSYYSDINRGIGFSKNMVLSHAKGDYVFFCDCDDYLESNCISSLVETAKSNNFPDIVIGGFVRADEAGNILYERHYKTPQQALQKSIPPWAKLLKRDFLLKNNILFPEGVLLEDVLYQSRIVTNNPSVAITDYCGYVWVNNKNSVSNTRFTCFEPNTLDLGFKYLKETKQIISSKRKNAEIMNYYAMQFVCWHLLRAGCKIGKSIMQAEYSKAFNYMEEIFPTYKKLSYISPFKPKGTRLIIRFVILTVVFLKKIGLAKSFFNLYSILNLRKLWPSL